MYFSPLLPFLILGGFTGTAVALLSVFRPRKTPAERRWWPTLMKLSFVYGFLAFLWLLTWDLGILYVFLLASTSMIGFSLGYALVSWFTRLPPE